MAIGVVASYNQGKPQMVQKTITTMADVGAGNIAVLLGTSVAVHRQLEAKERIFNCLQDLRERGFPKPTTAGNYAAAGVNIDHGKGQVSFQLNNLSTATPVETDVAVVYSDTFDNVPHSTQHLQAMALQAFQVVRERTLVVS